METQLTKFAFQSIPLLIHMVIRDFTGIQRTVSGMYHILRRCCMTRHNWLLCMLMDTR